MWKIAIDLHWICLFHLSWQHISLDGEKKFSYGDIRVFQRLAEDMVCVCDGKKPQCHIPMRFLHLLYIWRQRYSYSLSAVASDLLSFPSWCHCVMYYWGVVLYFLAFPFTVCILCLKFLTVGSWPGKNKKRGKASLISDHTVEDKLCCQSMFLTMTPYNESVTSQGCMGGEGGRLEVGWRFLWS